jgi:2-oxoglutarate ferredoxin oxidoreductase subunit beta
VGRVKAMIRRACEVQVADRAFAIVEVLSTCPVGWGMTPREAARHLADDVPATYPLGVLVDRFRDPPAGGNAR